MIEGDVAMSLLATNGKKEADPTSKDVSNGSGTKRPFEAVGGGGGSGSGGESTGGTDRGAADTSELDDFLQQAEKTKNDTLANKFR